MNTLSEKLKPKKESVLRVPAITFRGESALKIEMLLRRTGLTATRLVSQIVQHTLEADSSIKKLLLEGKALDDPHVQSPKQQSSQRISQ